MPRHHSLHNDTTTPPSDAEQQHTHTPPPMRTIKSTKRDERTEEMENRLKNKKKARELRDAARREKDAAKQERENYRATHPGFYNPNLRIHGFLSVLLGVLSLFITLSLLLRQHSGAAGAAIADGLLGCFSWAAYILPIFMMVHAITWRSDIRERTLVKKAIAFLPALLMTSILAALLSPGFDPNLPYDAGRAYLDGTLYFAGGGVIGNLFGGFLYRTIGVVGVTLIALGAYGFFFALHFRAPLKIAYARLRVYVKEARVARAKRRAEEEEAKHNQATAPTVSPSAQPDSEPKAAPLSTAEESDVTVLPHTLPTAEADGRAKGHEDKSTTRKRAFFADFEDTIDIERSTLPDAPRARQLFDFENQGAVESDEDVSPIHPTRTPGRASRPTGRAARTAIDTADDDFGGRLGVTRERVRPVRVAEANPETPAEEERNMDYFRRITVSADKREEQNAEPWQQPASRAHTAQVTPPAHPEEDQAEDTNDEDMFDVEVPTASEPAFTPTSSLRADLAEAERRGLREEAPRPTATVQATTATHPAYGAQKPAPARATAPKKAAYRFPPLSLLRAPEVVDTGNINAEVQANAQKLVEVLDNFRVHTTVTGYSRGPRITRYEIVPEAGIRVRAISALVDDISMALASAGVRIEAPIPGKPAVGVEVPNANPTVVRLRSMLDSDKFRNAPDKTMVCIGADVTGQPVYCELAKMPHLLVAGATGMGKSVCVNCILTSILYKASPDDVKLILIDPKKVEFAVYRGIPHLLVPVVTDSKKAAGALSWAVSEMERRYELFEHAGVPNLKDYNRYVGETGEGEPMPRIVIVIDELADLMMSAKEAVETSIARITAKARAAGIHLLIGTQRPSVDVITGTIKNNIPSRIAFHVPSQADSRTILDFAGAEKLLDKGDILYAPAGSSKPLRVQGAFVDVKEEISHVVDFLKTNNEIDPDAGERIMADIEREAEKCTPKKGGGEDEMPSGGGSNIPTDDDDMHLQWAALEVGFEFGRMSTSLLQRKLSIGYGKAAKILDALESQGLITAQEGAKPREIRITREEFKEMMAREVEKQCGGNF